MKKQPRLKIDLNGTWRLQPGEADRPPKKWDHQVPVPALVDNALPAYAWENHEYHWYRTVFRLPAARRRKAAFLRIEQSMFGTAVWLNGRFLGEDIACYTSQEYRLDGALRFGAENELVVRVGAKKTLPPESAVGQDFERLSWIPGIWGDVSILLHGSPRIRLVQTLPRLERRLVVARVWVENLSDQPASAAVAVRVREKHSRRWVSAKFEQPGRCAPRQTTVLEFEVPIEDCRSWSPESPFLYELAISVKDGGGECDASQTTFGMREFQVIGADFYLNGRKIFLRGSNIAFHRFLSDRERGLLPWDMAWIQRILIDIPKRHHFNFFRNHLGQLYNRWYDIADAGGMLLQNEWMFWTTTGSKQQIIKEFTRWLQDNWNHPSIIIWDPLNESASELIQQEIVPMMKNLDPTRPWESVDFTEDHPYIYSLGPVLVDRRFGFTRSLADIENSATPSMVNEYLWWWIDRAGRPSELTREVVSRWLGESPTTRQVLDWQSFLATELTELFRRLRVRAIQPFVYLSANEGPTAHWFQGPIAELRPKPVLRALKNAFAPFGVSIELWDRHFFPGEQRTIPIHIFNDEPWPQSGTLRYGISDERGNWLAPAEQQLNVAAGDRLIIPAEIAFPGAPGGYFVRAELTPHRDEPTTAHSQKIAHVIAPPEISAALAGARIALLDSRSEIADFLRSLGLNIVSLEAATLAHCQVLLVAPGESRQESYQRRSAEISAFVRAGHALVVLEPEFGIEGKERLPVLENLAFEIKKREDRDRGGYDSFIFPADASHPVWQQTPPAHLQLFNGALGGEIVSQHDVVPLAPHTVLARCGLQLRVIAAAEMAYGKGRVLLSRLQLRGRLQPPGKNSPGLYDRRPDPVARRHLVNVLASCL